MKMKWKYTLCWGRISEENYMHCKSITQIMHLHYEVCQVTHLTYLVWTVDGLHLGLQQRERICWLCCDWYAWLWRTDRGSCFLLSVQMILCTTDRQVGYNLAPANSCRMRHLRNPTQSSFQRYGETIHSQPQGSVWLRQTGECVWMHIMMAIYVTLKWGWVIQGGIPPGGRVNDIT